MHSTSLSPRRLRTTLGLALGGVVMLLLSACDSMEDPSTVGTIADLHLTTAGVDEVCDDDGCQTVPRPDKCFVYVETPANGFVEAQVWCDAYTDLNVGDKFTDGTHVLNSNCVYKDKNGRWQGVVGTDDCKQFSDDTA
jgi:hypothetical protein